VRRKGQLSVAYAYGAVIGCRDFSAPPALDAVEGEEMGGRQRATFEFIQVDYVEPVAGAGVV
jgi:hypothetical protein